MKSNYLITGGTGFVGSNIIRSLVEKGERVSLIARNKNLNWRLSDLSKKVDVYEGEITKPSIGNIVNKIKRTTETRNTKNICPLK